MSGDKLLDLRVNRDGRSLDCWLAGGEYRKLKSPCNRNDGQKKARRGYGIESHRAFVDLRLEPNIAFFYGASPFTALSRLNDMTCSSTPFPFLTFQLTNQIFNRCDERQ